MHQCAMICMAKLVRVARLVSASSINALSQKVSKSTVVTSNVAAS